MLLFLINETQMIVSLSDGKAQEVCEKILYSLRGLKSAKPEELVQKALDGNGSKLQKAFIKNEKTHAMGK